MVIITAKKRTLATAYATLFRIIQKTLIPHFCPWLIDFPFILTGVLFRCHEVTYNIALIGVTVTLLHRIHNQKKRTPRDRHNNRYFPVYFQHKL